MDIGSIGRRFEDALPNLVGIGAFLEQITTGAQSTIGSQSGFSNQAETLVNCVVGRITGYNPFSARPTFVQKFNPSGVINKWVGLSIVAYVYAEMGLPGGPMARKISGPLFVGGLIGGLFDDPKPVGQSLVAGQSGGYLQSPSGYYQPSLAQSVAAVQAYQRAINSVPGAIPRIPGA